MKTIIFSTLALLISVKAFADTPNAFNPSDMSSESIYVGITACEEQMEKSGTKDSSNVRFSYCACIVDAFRVNNKISNANVTFCLNRAHKIYGGGK